MRIAIVGKITETNNYVQYVRGMNLDPCVTLNLGEVTGCSCRAEATSRRPFSGRKTEVPKMWIRN